MTTNIDILAGNPRRATVGKVLRDRHPLIYNNLRDYVDDAAAILDALDEHDSFGTHELQEANPAGLTTQAIRLEVLRALMGTEGYVQEVDGNPARFVPALTAVADPLAAWVETGVVDREQLPDPFAEAEARP